MSQLVAPRNNTPPNYVSHDTGLGLGHLEAMYHCGLMSEHQSWELTPCCRMMTPLLHTQLTLLYLCRHVQEW
jgi:hypothetical protein